MSKKLFFRYSLSVVLLLIFISIGFLSCDSITGKNSHKNIACIRISLGQPEPRTALPDITLETIKNYDFTLKGTKDSVEKTLGTFTGTNALTSQAIAIETGDWIFELTAEGDGTVLKATTETVTITSGTNSISFELELQVSSLEGTGSLSFTLDYSDAPNASDVKAVTGELVYCNSTTWQEVSGSPYSISVETSETEGYISIASNVVTYNIPDNPGITAGYYIIKIKLYADNAKEHLINTWPEYAIITGGHQSKQTRQMTSLNQVYTIEWYNIEGITETVSFPQIYTRLSTDIDLPEISKSGLTFGGWYNSPDEFASGTPVTSIPANSTGNRTFYARWISYGSSGSITTNDGLINITVDIPEKIYVNEGSVSFNATLKNDGTDISTDSGITWNAKLLYGGMDVNDYGTYYTVTAPSGSEHAKIELTDSLDTAGAYQLFVSAEYDDVVSSQTFNLDLDSYHLVLAGYDFTDSTQQADFAAQVALAAKSGAEVELTLSGTGTDGTDGTDGTLAFISEQLSNIQKTIDCDMSGLSGVSKIASGVFGETPAFKNLVLPQGIQEIGDYAFISCNTLKTITIPDSVTTVGDLVFPLGDQSQLTQFIVTGTATKKACTTAFDGALLINNTYEGVTLISSKIVGSILPSLANITSLDFTQGELASITGIGSYIFAGITSLTTITGFGNVTEIGMAAFSGCRNLQNFNVSGIQTIGRQAFNKTAITSVTLNASLQSLGDEAFYECNNLATVTIPAALHTELNMSAFERCEGISSFVISGDYTDGQTLKYSAPLSGALLVKEAPDDTNPGTSIKSVVFAACAAPVTTINFADSSLQDITIIEPYAFNPQPESGEVTSNLRTITSFGNITTIGEYAFAGSPIETIGNFGSVTEIGDYAFSASNVQSALDFNNVATLGGYAFYGASNLTEISSFGNITSISYEAFAQTGLTTIPPFEAGMTIADYAFLDSSITDFEFNSTDVAMGNPGLRTNGGNARIIINVDMDADETDGANNLKKLWGNDPEYLLCGIENAVSIEFTGKVVLPDVGNINDGFNSTVGNTQALVYLGSQEYLGTTISTVKFTGSNSVIGDYQFCTRSYDSDDDEYFCELENVDLSGVIAFGAYPFYRKDPSQLNFTFNSDEGDWYRTNDKSQWQSWLAAKPDASSISENKLTSTGDALIDEIKSIIAPSSKPATKTYLYKLVN